MAEDETRVPVSSDADIVTARRQGRAMAERLGFSSVDVTLITTAISELARNIVDYAWGGEIVMRTEHQRDRSGIVIIASDKGPGIPNVPLAMQDGYSTSRSLGIGLPGARRLVDDFEIVSEPGKGTTVTAKKWKR